MKDLRDITTLTEWDKNPRGITPEGLARLKKQIEKLGQYKPLLVNQDGIVLGGNMRMKAYKEMGMTEVWVSQVETNTEAEMLAYALSDNDRAGFYENDLLRDLYDSNPDFDWSDYAVDLDKPVTLDKIFLKEPVQDEVPEVDEVEVVSELGKIYQLGSHRLMCGDATKEEDVAKLMDGETASMIFTDPPYNVNYEGSMNAEGKNEREGIMNDDMTDEDFSKFLEDSMSAMLTL
jgi:site-specific DNA-methyltransferase (adenine-specific)